MPKRSVLLLHSLTGSHPRVKPWAVIAGIVACVLLLSCSPDKELDWHQEDGYRWAEAAPGNNGNPGFEKLPSSQTQINFENVVSEEEIAANHHYLNGSGVATADVDGDGLVDLYFAQLGGPNRLYKNLGNWEFREITDSAGVAHNGYYSTGVVFADVNGDNAPDLLVSSIHKGVTLYLNDGNGTFSANSQNSFKSTRNKGNTTLSLADIDGDSDLDLYVTNYRERSIDDIKELEELTWENTVKEEYSQDRDNYTLLPPFDDFYTLIPREGMPPDRREIGEKDQLFLNDGAGNFTEVTDTETHFLDAEGNPAGLSRDWGLAAKFQDLNEDGLPDLYVCNDFWTPDRVWLNQDDGVFKAADPNTFPNYSFSSMAVDFSDINRDGAVDLFVTEMLSQLHQRRLQQYVPDEPFPDIRFKSDRQPQYNRNSLYLNRGDNTFAEIAYYSGLEASEWSWATMFMDVDLDGYEDLLINTGFSYDVQDLDTRQRMERQIQQGGLQSTGHIVNYPSLDLPNHAFRNNGDLTFSDVSSDWGFEQPDISHGMAVADLDQDGDLDIVSNRLNQTAAVYNNKATAPRIAVRLAGHPPNTLTYGAKLKLTGGPVEQQQQITAGGDYLSGSEPVAVFAADASNANHRLTITWPDGRRSILDSLRANRIYEIQNPITEKANHPDPDSTAEDQPVFEDISGRINHSHSEAPYDDFRLQPLLPVHLSRQGPGVSWIDYDRDGDDDLFIASARNGKTGIFENQGKSHFQRVQLPEIPHSAPGDQTTVLGWRAGQATTLLVGSANYEQGDVEVPSAYQYSIKSSRQVQPDSLASAYSTTGPMAAADYDGDGDLDLFVGGRFLPLQYPRSANSRLFLNNDGDFQLDNKNSARLEEVGLVTGAVFSDVDQDGAPDLLLSTEWGAIKLFRNSGGTFREVTHNVGLNQYKGWWKGITTGDFNNDGRPDIIATNIGLNSPYQLEGHERPLRMYYEDFNKDSRLDIIEAYYSPEHGGYVPRRQLVDFESIPNTVLRYVQDHNEFAGATLQEILGQNPNELPSKSINTLQHMVFINEGNSFSAHPLPVKSQFTAAFSANVADYNNDGNEDIFLSQNQFSVRPLLPRLDAGRGLWLKGDGNGHFDPVPGQESGVKIYGEQRGAALADFNRDGRVDLVVGQNDGRTRLFRNQTERTGVRVRLEGPSANGDAIGSSVRLVYQDGTKGPRREIQAGSGYWSQNSVTQVLGRAEEVDAIEITWFDGTTQTVDAKAGQTDYLIKY